MQARALFFAAYLTAIISSRLLQAARLLKMQFYNLLPDCVKKRYVFQEYIVCSFDSFCIGFIVFHEMYYLILIDDEGAI